MIKSIPVVILAGGKAERMGGQDKGRLTIDGSRLIDRLIAQLHRQTQDILVAGAHDYELRLPTVPDDPEIHGPVGGLYGAVQGLKLRRDGVVGFVTVPIDGPSVAPDLVERLASSPSQSAIAGDAVRVHPTFAYWTLAALEAARPALSAAPSLVQVANQVEARHEVWADAAYFRNINTPDDLAAWRASAN